tara:strand:+ start:2519 stop:3751 length:1233 start_codon:yes stop_codon:yes gene_type:complete
MASPFQYVVSGAEKRGKKLLKTVYELAKKERTSNGKLGLEPDFTTGEAAKILGISKSALIKMEGEGTLDFEVRRRSSGSVSNRYFNYNEINKIRSIRGDLPRKPKGAKTKRIIFSNLKGGVGKSTHALHYAHFLASLGYRVLLVDGDPQGTQTGAFSIMADIDLNEGDDLTDALMKDPNLIRKSIRKTYWDNIDLIPARIELEFCDWIMTADFHKESEANTRLGPMPLRLNKALEVVEDEYDVIVIDTPPSLGVLSLNTIAAASHMVLPCSPTMYDISSVAKYFEIISSLLKLYSEFINPQHVSLLLTKIKPNLTQSSKSIIESLGSTYGDILLESTMGDSEALNSTASNVRSIYETRESTEKYKRGRSMMDAVNLELLGILKEMWANDLGTTNTKESTKGLSGFVKGGN